MLAVKTANAISTKKRFIGSPFEDCTSQTASGRQDEFGVSIADIGGIIRKIQQIDRTRIEHEIQNTTPITNQRGQAVQPQNGTADHTRGCHCLCHLGGVESRGERPHAVSVFWCDCTVWGFAAAGTYPPAYEVPPLAPPPLLEFSPRFATSPACSPHFLPSQACWPLPEGMVPLLDSIPDYL